MTRYSISNRLFVNPSIIEGMARLFDFGNNLQVYNTSPASAEADTAALKSDWYAVGQDMKDSISTYEQQSSESTEKR